MATIRVGNAEIDRVEELVLRMRLADIVQDEDVIARNSHWLKPRFLDQEGMCDLVFQSWIVQVDGKVIVIDPCNGNGRTNFAFPVVHMLDTPYIERFAATGVRPEDVDIVFCTHLHCDHCGWNTQLRGGRYVPTFPNARYIFVRREFDRWDTRRPDHRPVAVNKDVFENSILPVVEAGLAELVNDEHRLAPSLTILPARGHTAAHAMVHLISQAEEACFIGDALHHPLELLAPDKVDRHIDEDADIAIATRHQIVTLSLERNALLIPGHFPAPYAGWMRRKGNELMFEPLAQ